MDPEDTAYQEIRKIITTKQLQNDLPQIGEVVHYNTFRGMIYFY